MWSRIKIFLLLLALALISPLIHNAIYAFLGIEEPVFFLLFFLFFFGAIIYLLETVVFYLKYRQAKGPKKPNKSFKFKRALSWVLMLGILGITWAALHDLAKGEPDPRLEYLFLTGCAFVFSLFTIFLFKEKCQ